MLLLNGLTTSQARFVICKICEVLHNAYHRNANVNSFIKAFKSYHRLYQLECTGMALQNNSTPVQSNQPLERKKITQRNIKVWNSLPMNVVNASSNNSFKNRLDSLRNYCKLCNCFKANTQPRNQAVKKTHIIN